MHSRIQFAYDVQREQMSWHVLHIPTVATVQKVSIKMQSVLHPDDVQREPKEAGVSQASQWWQTHKGYL